MPNNEWPKCPKAGEVRAVYPDVFRPCALKEIMARGIDSKTVSAKNCQACPVPDCYEVLRSLLREAEGVGTATYKRATEALARLEGK